MHTNFDEEIYTEPNVNRQNNIIVGIAVGIIIVSCALIYVAGVVMEVIVK